MTFDPYDTLGVARDANSEDVQAAYHRKAKETHPDAGGTAEAFQEVNRANMILSDPAKRERFDATGQFDEGPDIIDQAAFNLINSVLQAVLAADVDPVTLDLIEQMRLVIGQDLTGFERARQPVIKARDRAVKLLGRFKGKQATQFDRMLNWHREQAESQLANVDAAIAQRKRALELLEGCTFDVDKPVPTAVDRFASAYGSGPQFSDAWGFGRTTTF